MTELAMVSLILILMLTPIPADAETGRDRSEPEGDALRKLALLVGISDYNPAEGWSTLNCQKDVLAMQKVLTEHFQFAPRDVVTLTAKHQTTRQNIIKTFRNHLIRQAAGAVVVFHYSGHGGQALDDNGDELDRLDETIVPSDHAGLDDRSKDIRDDLLTELLEELKQENPANITVIMDSCHAGSATRSGSYLVRGKAYTGIKPKPLPRSNADRPERERGLFGHADGYVLLSAARHDELAKEDPHEEMGVFTYHLVRALEEAKPESTYRDVFERVCATMRGKVQGQNPQLEGDINTILLNGTAKDSDPVRYLLLQPTRPPKPNRFVVNAGKLHGMTENSVFAIYRPWTEAIDFQNTNRIAEATVTQVDTLSSELTLNEAYRKIAPEQFEAARAIEITHDYGDSRLRLAMDQSHPDASLLAEALKVETHPGIYFRGLATAPPEFAYDIFIRAPVKLQDAPSNRGEIDGPGEYYLLERADGTHLPLVKKDSDVIKEIHRLLKNERRVRLLKTLENRDRNAHIQTELRIVKVQVEVDADGAVVGQPIDLPEARDEGGHLTFRVGDIVMIELRNTGRLECYVNVIDIKPDSTIGPILPLPGGEHVHENIANDGEWHRIRECYQIEPLYGVEAFKVIATTEPTDFAFLFSDNPERGTRGLGANSPLGQLLIDATTGTRAAKRRRVPRQNWSTFTVEFTVVD